MYSDDDMVATFPTPAGTALLRWPRQLSEADLARVRAWLALVTELLLDPPRPAGEGPPAPSEG